MRRPATGSCARVRRRILRPRRADPGSDAREDGRSWSFMVVDGGSALDAQRRVRTVGSIMNGRSHRAFARRIADMSLRTPDPQCGTPEQACVSHAKMRWLFHSLKHSRAARAV